MEILWKTEQEKIKAKEVYQTLSVKKFKYWPQKDYPLTYHQWVSLCAYVKNTGSSESLNLSSKSYETCKYCGIEMESKMKQEMKPKDYNKKWVYLKTFKCSNCHRTYNFPKYSVSIVEADLLLSDNF